MSGKGYFAVYFDQGRRIHPAADKHVLFSPSLRRLMQIDIFDRYLSGEGGVKEILEFFCGLGRISTSAVSAGAA
jgi:hypothetical protein